MRAGRSTASEALRGALDAGLALPWERLWRPVQRAGAWVLALPLWSVLVVLLLAQWAVVLIIAAVAQHNGVYYYTGGDATWYWTSAWVLGHGSIPHAAISEGYVFLLAPLAHFAGPSMIAGLPFVIALNMLVLWPIALLAVYGITKAIGGRGFAYLATLLWTIFPLISIPYFYERYHVRLIDQNLPSALGLIATGDFPSLVALLVAAYFALRTISERSPQSALIAGAAAGFAVTVKPANLIFLPAPIAAFVVARRGRELLLAAAAFAPALGGLALWKYRGLGYLPAFHTAALAAGALTPPPVGTLELHRYIHLDWHHLWVNYLYVREYTWSVRMVTWVLVAGIVGLARRSVVTAVLLGGWLTCFVVLKGTSAAANVSDGSFFRYLEPAFPPFFFGLVAIVLLVPIVGRRLVARARAEGFAPISRRGWTALLAVAAAALVVPLVALAAFHPLAKPQAAGLSLYDQYVPANTFGLTAIQRGKVVHLAWPGQGTRRTLVSYKVFREPRDEFSCTRQGAPGTFCSFFLIDPVTETYVIPVSTTFRRGFVDRPPPGTWIYRVLATVSPARQPAGDSILLSRAAKVDVKG